MYTFEFRIKVQVYLFVHYAKSKVYENLKKCSSNCKPIPIPIPIPIPAYTCSFQNTVQYIKIKLITPLKQVWRKLDSLYIQMLAK